MNGIQAVQNSCSAEIEDLAVSQPAAEPEVTEEEGTIAAKLVFDPPASAAKGSTVILKGKLVRADSDKGISDAKIQIMDADRSFMNDDIITFAATKASACMDASTVSL